MNDLKENIKTLAVSEGMSELEVISMLQTQAVQIGDDTLLDALSDIKWGIIETEFNV